MVLPVLSSKETVVPRNKRWFVSSILLLVSALVVGLGAWSVVDVSFASLASSGPAPLKIYHAAHVTYETARDVPVLVYHEMNNGCPPEAETCDAKDPETVSSLQFHNEMYWLFSQGYHTVTLPQYLAWLADGKTKLPSKPILITADNGIFSFLNGAQETLADFGFTAVASIVTGFADGASGYCVQKIGTIDVQPGCPGGNRYWDATWKQLQGFSQQGVWSFMLEAGASGHYVQDYDSSCTEFDVCLLPGETTAQYELRVRTELTSGETELAAKLGTKGVYAGAWVVPYSDIGYKQCAQSDCTPQNRTAPSWLIGYAASHFQAVFVEDAYRNGTSHERFRFDVNGQDTEADFQSQLAAFAAAGAFNRTR